MILPELRARLAVALQALILRLFLQLLYRHRISATFSQIALRTHKDDGHVLADLSDLGSPFAHIVKRVSVIYGHAEHESIRAIIAHSSVDTEMGISAGIVDLDRQILVIKFAGALENIKHSWLVKIIEDLSLIVDHEARLSDRCVADKHDLYLLWPSSSVRLGAAATTATEKESHLFC